MYKPKDLVFSTVCFVLIAAVTLMVLTAGATLVDWYVHYQFIP